MFDHFNIFHCLFTYWNEFFIYCSEFITAFKIQFNSFNIDCESFTLLLKWTKERLERGKYLQTLLHLFVYTVLEHHLTLICFMNRLYGYWKIITY